MSRDDWYRRTTWTAKDAQEFHARNQRSRGDANKAQYLRIQAECLLDTGDANLVGPALELIELALERSPGTIGHSACLDCAGRCLEALARPDEAIDHFLAALDYQSTTPAIQTNATFHLGRVVTGLQSAVHYDATLAALDTFGSAVFPWHTYMMDGIRARIAADRGDVRLARSLARSALEAARVADSGLGWGRDEVGVVEDRLSIFSAAIRQLAV